MKNTIIAITLCFSFSITWAQKTQKPPLHAKHWMAITGKPLGATAGAQIFHEGGNAIDAACAMLGATCTMWDVLSWGGETQALIYHPELKKVIGINACGVAPTGATPEFFREKEMRYPPKEGPLAATTPGTFGGLATMLAEYGTMSLKEVLRPAMEMAQGYPMEAQTSKMIENKKRSLMQWPYSKKLFYPHLGESWEGPQAGEVFVQKDLHATLIKLVEAEQQALNEGKTRKEAIYAAYDRFYKGDIAEEIVRSTQEQGGLFTLEDLSNWKVKIEEPLSTTYKDIEVFKLSTWTQGPVLLQALNMAEQIDLKGMGYNSSQYIHTLYQIMNLTFADRDFYYGDPDVDPKEPIEALLSKRYAAERILLIQPDSNDAKVQPGDPYAMSDEDNPYQYILDRRITKEDQGSIHIKQDSEFPDEDFYLGTTSIQAADSSGWVVSITPSGGWLPAVIAGETGIGLSQRMQSFVLRRDDNPFNIVQAGQRPRVTLTPSMALKDGKPFISFAVQGGDSQDQNQLQFLLNMLEFDMTVQQAVEAPNFNSFQLKESFGDHRSKAGRMLINQSLPTRVKETLQSMGYRTTESDRTSGPINAIYFDHLYNTMWGGSSNHGEDYGIGW